MVDGTETTTTTTDPATPAGSSASGTPAGGTPAAGAKPGDPPAGGAPAALTQEQVDKYIADLAPEKRTEFTKKFVPAAPDKYTLKLPEKSVLDATVTERTTAIARELGLSTDDGAQKVLDFTNQEVAKALEATVAAHQPGGAEWTKQADAWKAAAFADPDLGDGKQAVFDATVAKAKAVLEKFAPPGMIEFLHNTGYGSNPDVLRFLSKIAKASGDGSLITGSGGSKSQKTAADTIYGDTPTPSGATT
jgi:hypothetical protein